MKKTILFLYPEVYFTDFIKEFLEIFDYSVVTAIDNVEGLRLGIKVMPDLIIMNKEFSSLDARGFLIKKRTLGVIRDVPIFMIGDFSPVELFQFKNDKVQAFISSPLNPTALMERINIYFKKENNEDSTHTPMLLDMHVRGNIINVQIEGNFDPAKLTVFNYLLRTFCIQKKIKKPRVFIIVPSLYPESITKTNLEYLFRFSEYEEFQIIDKYVKILTVNTKLKKVIQKHPEYKQYEVVENYVDGMQMLQIDFDKEKKIPVDFIKPGSSYIYDLFDKKGHKMISAMTRITEETIEKIKAKKISTLTYYSDKSLSEVPEQDPDDMTLLEDDLLVDIITDEFEPIETELNSIQIVDEKQSLFFRKMKGQDMLIITKDKDFVRFIAHTLEVYFNISFASNGNNIRNILSKKRFTIIFIDSDVNDPHAIEILKNIRANATRRKTSVIILARKIDKTEVIRYRKFGTNNIILSPFSTAQILIKVFQSVSSDRQT